MLLGCECVCEVKAQTHRREYKELQFKTSESIEGFALWLTAIIDYLELPGDPVDEYKECSSSCTPCHTSTARW
jgi:hypothetical protein